jgi:hypothetical protein
MSQIDAAPQTKGIVLRKGNDNVRHIFSNGKSGL